MTPVIALPLRETLRLHVATWWQALSLCPLVERVCDLPTGEPLRTAATLAVDYRQLPHPKSELSLGNVIHLTACCSRG